MTPLIRPAETRDAEALTVISFASKRYWDYPDAYFDIWKDELTITPDYIREHTVWVLEKDKTPAGYYAVVHVAADFSVSGILIPKGIWLDHYFLAPECIGSGLGRHMFAHLKAWCRTNSIEQVSILADPHAGKFYEKMGCRFIRDYPSTIPGRTTPLFKLFLK